MRLTPLAWISAKEQTVFENMPTEYGPATLRFQKNTSGDELNVEVSANWRARASHPDCAPQTTVTGLKKIQVNGKTTCGETEEILITL